MSLAQVARRADVPERSFAHYAAQRSEPDLSSLVRIAKALGVSTDYLLGLDAGPGNHPLEESDRLREKIRAACLLLDPTALKFADHMMALLVEHEHGRTAKTGS
jgi:transcriptional regulator with XRE-family HTH domain